MREKRYITLDGSIHYWINDLDRKRPSLVFLPGLTADHTLFDEQVKAFEPKYNIMVWDAPGHASSRPFNLDFDLEQKAVWLHSILKMEAFDNPVLIGQSMGGYLSQVYNQLFPGEISGFISIDSAPLKKKYYPDWEIRLLYHIEPVYRMYPWKLLVFLGSRGTAETKYGRALMSKMMETYSNNPRYYSELVGHGYKMLADAVSKDLPCDFACPVLLICGKRDKAGDTKSFNRRWASGENYPIEWIPRAGHNSNTDRPQIVNKLIADFLGKIFG